MQKLTLDPSLKDKFTAALELTDDTGRTLGFFVTPEEHARMRSAIAEQHRQDYARAQAVFTDERLAAADAEGGEYTTEEVLDYLESRSANRPPASPRIPPAEAS